LVKYQEKRKNVCWIASVAEKYVRLPRSSFIFNFQNEEGLSNAVYIYHYI